MTFVKIPEDVSKEIERNTQRRRRHRFNAENAVAHPPSRTMRYNGIPLNQSEQLHTHPQEQQGNIAYPKQNTTFNPNRSNRFAPPQLGYGQPGYNSFNRFNQRENQAYDAPTTTTPAPPQITETQNNPQFNANIHPSRMSNFNQPMQQNNDTRFNNTGLNPRFGTNPSTRVAGDTPYTQPPQPTRFGVTSAVPTATTTTTAPPPSRFGSISSGPVLRNNNIPQRFGTISAPPTQQKTQPAQQNQNQYKSNFGSRFGTISGPPTK